MSSEITETPTAGDDQPVPAAPEADGIAAATEETASALKKKKGRKLGAKKWSEAETDYLLNCVELELPTGAKMWEQVALAHLLAYPTTNRTSEACKKRFDKLARQEKPTGNNEIPRQVQRAKNIQEDIDREEVMGISTLNDDIGEDNDDEDDGSASDNKAFTGTRLIAPDDNTPRKPTTKKRKQGALADAIAELADRQAEGSSMIAKAFGSLNGTENPRGMSERMDGMSERMAKIETKLDKMADVVTKIDSFLEYINNKDNA